jgi:PBP1b-binding outer membrane lipoprotein LpoB
MMTLNKGNTQRQIRASILCVICACTVLLSGCSKAANENTQVTNPTPSAEATTPVATNSVTEQPNASSSSYAERLPEGVSIQRVIKDVSLKDGYHKKIELLTDGGKLVTITDPNQKIVLQQIEYEGRITAANGKQVTVNVEGGAEQTITIPDHVVIEDEDKLGLNKGIEIEWTVNAEGQIESVELDD